MLADDLRISTDAMDTESLLKGGGCDGWFVSFWRLTARIFERIFSLSERHAQELVHDRASDLVVAAMGTTHDKAVEVARCHVNGRSAAHGALHSCYPSE